MSDTQDLIKRHGIALTGGIATGKSTVADLLRQAGELVIDADQLARDTTKPGSPGLERIVAAFGRDVLNPDGTLNRRALGAKVFADARQRRILEQITHPLIREALQETLRSLGWIEKPRRFFYEAALIFETGTDANFREVWATLCAPETQRARLMARDGLDAAQAERVLASQMPAAAKAARANVVIDTDRDLEAIRASLEQLLAPSDPRP